MGTKISRRRRKLSEMKLAQPLIMRRPNIFGTRVSSGKHPEIEATPITRWKGAGKNKYRASAGQATSDPAPGRYSAGHKQRNESDGKEHWRREPNFAPHRVPSQLKVFTAEGTPIESVRIEKVIAE